MILKENIGSSSMIEGIKARKPILIAGVVILTISLCFIFPFEYNRTNYITDLKLTFLSLAIAMFTLMFGLMGKHFYKGLLFLICSTLFSFIAWFFLYPVGWLSAIVAIWGGIPSGVIAGLLFMLFNFQFIKDENRYILFFKRLISYLVILGIVSILFDKGGDWIFDISEYFKSSKMIDSHRR